MSATLHADANMESRWYVLNHIAPAAAGAARKAVDRFNSSAPAALELFAPTYVVREVRDGETRFRTAALTFHYVFVRGTLPEVKALCAQPNGFSFLIDRAAADRYATVSDSTMTAFRTIAHAYNNRLPYFSLADIELEAGDLVEVIHGDFPGLTGTYIPTPKSRSGNVVLTIYNNVGTVAFNVKASDVRVLRFSPLTTRANDQLDAFLPVLLSALRHHAASGPLPRTLAAKLAVFTGRMAAVRMDTRKLDARLQMLLYGAHTLLGNTAGARAALARYDRVKAAVTNPWTRAAHRLILAVLSGDPASIESLRGLQSSSLQSSGLQSSSLQSSSLQYLQSEQSDSSDKSETLSQHTTHNPRPLSRLQRLILAEYTHYLEEAYPRTDVSEPLKSHNTLLTHKFI